MNKSTGKEALIRIRPINIRTEPAEDENVIKLKASAPEKRRMTVNKPKAKAFIVGRVKEKPQIFMKFTEREPPPPKIDISTPRRRQTAIEQSTTFTQRMLKKPSMSLLLVPGPTPGALSDGEVLPGFEEEQSNSDEETERNKRVEFKSAQELEEDAKTKEMERQRRLHFYSLLHPPIIIVKPPPPEPEHDPEPEPEPEPETEIQEPEEPTFVQDEDTGGEAEELNPPTPLMMPTPKRTRKAWFETELTSLEQANPTLSPYFEARSAADAQLDIKRQQSGRSEARHRSLLEASMLQGAPHNPIMARISEDHTIVQPEFMLNHGTMCVTEFWSEKQRRTFAQRMGENVTQFRFDDRTQGVMKDETLFRPSAVKGALKVETRRSQLLTGFDYTKVPESARRPSARAHLPSISKEVEPIKEPQTARVNLTKNVSSTPNLIRKTVILPPKLVVTSVEEPHPSMIQSEKVAETPGLPRKRLIAPLRPVSSRLGISESNVAEAKANLKLATDMYNSFVSILKPTKI
eukprot:TRINITY_DN10885_c0_g1_i2.p1 TRINITY_DN10885_c0_g1~~TRINITY_DN10885_c0_g1_i2.p1  ORF type:complete len:519 (+),score=93.39 TRINITY_DN10885_c0_g1_i2:126-1682(+)